VTAWLFAIIIAAPTLALFWVALGTGAFVFSRPDAPVRGKGRSRPGADDAEKNGILDIAIGGLVHLGFSAGAAFRRAVAQARENAAARRDAETADWRAGGAEPSLGGRVPNVAVLGDERREPAINIERRIFSPGQSEASEDDGYAVDEEEDDEIVAPTRRVAAPARRPAPGSRAAREAQASLLDDNSGFELPALNLLAEAKHKGMLEEHRPERLEAMARRLEGVLEDFGVKGDIINVRPGPVVTLYELEPAPGIKSSRVISLADDIARSMSAISARVAVVPGRNAIGIELPNETRETVYLREMLSSQDFEKMKGKLPICLGKTIGGEPIIADLARMPHLLIAGTTGSGKSVGINTFILSLLYQMTPEQCRLIMIDPKMLELSIYDGIPHLLTPVVTDPSKAVTALKWAVREMEDRYRKMSKIGVRNIDGFNQRVTESAAKGEVITRTVQTGFDRETGEAIYESEEFNLEPLPFIVVVIDEMADLMMVAGKDIEGAVQRLAQMARAAGIHVIMATQRPSVDVITGTIKANFPTRISFQVTSKIDSRTILGEQGAEQLLGNGDMLYMAGGGRIRRLHGPFVSDGEVESIVRHLKSQGAPDYLDSITADEDELDEDGMADTDQFGGSGDELYDKAVNIVLQDKKASTSYVQRRLAIGYNRAASLIERMEKEGVISPANHSGKREILVGSDPY
jgi:S-DNA-T family DNA segregation ATPase FtsK/SpoIIIE